MATHQMISGKNRLQIGLNDPITNEDLINYNEYTSTEAIDGMIFYIDPDGITTLKSGTKIRGFRIGEIYYPLIERIIPILYTNENYNDISLIFLLTCKENCLVNFKYETIKPSVTFIGGIDMDGKYYKTSHFDFVENQDIFIKATKEEIYTSSAEDKINILEELTFDQAQENFNNNEPVIMIRDGEQPIKLYTKTYKDKLDILSNNQNDFEIFCNHMHQIIVKHDEYINNFEFIKKLKDYAENCQAYLSIICIHKDWKKEKEKFCKNIDHLMSIIKKVDLGITIEKTDKFGKKVGLPQNFFTIKKMKLNSSKSFFQKLFTSERGVSYRMLNKITDYN